MQRVPSIGCQFPYLKAASTFSAATTTGTASFAPIIDAKSDLCVQRAHLNYLLERIEAAGPVIPFGKYFEQRTTPVLQVAGSIQDETWAHHCEVVASSDEVVRRSLAALDGYSAALKAVADGAEPDGENLQALDKSLNQAATSLQKILTVHGSNARFTDDLKTAVVNPISAIVQLAIQFAANTAIKKAVIESDSSVQKILAGLTVYAEGTRAEVRDAERLMRLVLTRADEKSPKDATPLYHFQMYDIAEKSAAASTALRRTQSDYEAVLASLATAHGALKSAADQKMSDKAVLAAVVQAATEILNRVSAIQKAAH